MGIHLITFADGSLRWRLAGKRLENQAKQSGWFSSIRRWNARRLQEEIPAFAEDNPNLNPNETRGYGYWLWRPYILQKELSLLASGDSLIFLDAGCQLNLTPGSEKRFNEYIQLARTNGNLVMQIDELLWRWCKPDLLSHFTDFGDTGSLPLLEPGVLILTNSPANRDLTSEWIYWGRKNDFHYIDDSPSRLPTPPGFVEHRHDQAILTCLSSRHPMFAIPQETYFPNAWRDDGARFPIWALRNSTPFLLENSAPASQILTMSKRWRSQWHMRNRGELS